MAFSPAPLYASGEVFVPMSEEPSLPKMRDGEKNCIRKKDSRKREWGRERRDEVIATELTHIESNGSWGFWKISQHPHPFPQAMTHRFILYNESQTHVKEFLTLNRPHRLNVLIYLLFISLKPSEALKRLDLSQQGWRAILRICMIKQAIKELAEKGDCIKD